MSHPVFRICSLVSDCTCICILLACMYAWIGLCMYLPCLYACYYACMYACVPELICMYLPYLYACCLLCICTSMRMYVYVCVLSMYAWIDLYACACIYLVNMHVAMHFAPVHTHVCVCVHVYMHMRVCTLNWIINCVHACMHVCVCTIVIEIHDNIIVFTTLNSWGCDTFSGLQKISWRLHTWLSLYR